MSKVLLTVNKGDKKSFFLVITKRWLSSIAYMRLMACKDLTHVLGVSYFQKDCYTKKKIK